jgi:hypothetical protein
VVRIWRIIISISQILALNFLSLLAIGLLLKIATFGSRR